MAANKGYDDSPPRNGVIFFYTVLTLAMLVGVDALLDSYFAKMMDGEVHEKVLTRGLDHAYETRAREQEALEKSGIGKAMRAYAQRGRGASPVLTAESGAGKPAVGGWSQLKREVPSATSPAATPTQPAGVAPQPPGPNAAEPAALPPVQAPTKGESPVAPAGRPRPAAEPSTHGPGAMR